MTKKPRIAIIGDFPVGLVNSTYKSIKSTNSKWLYTLYSILQDEDAYEFHWIMIDKLYKEEDHFEHNGHFFHVYHGAKLTIGLHTAYLYDRWQIRKCLKSINPDIVHGWGTERCYGLATKDFNGRKLLSAQGVLVAYMQRSEVSPFERKQSRYEPSVYRAMDLVTAESPWALDRVRELAPNARLELWEYAADPTFADVGRHLTEKPAFFMAGSAAPVKNMKLAIEAFSMPELSHATLYIAGENHTYSVSDLPSNVIPLGFLCKEDIKKYLSQSWALLHPSLADSCPNIVKEARLIGLPVVLTSDCGAKQYVDDKKSGFVISPNNKEQFVKAVLKLASDRNLAIRMGEYQLLQCREALSIDTMRKGIKDIYYKLLHNI